MHLHADILTRRKCRQLMRMWDLQHQEKQDHGRPKTRYCGLILNCRRTLEVQTFEAHYILNNDNKENNVIWTLIRATSFGPKQMQMARLALNMYALATTIFMLGFLASLVTTVMMFSLMCLQVLFHLLDILRLYIHVIECWNVYWLIHNSTR